MPKARDPEDKRWEDLIRFLGTEPDAFGEKYLEIRRSLIRLFQWRGAHDPEALADETIERVAVKCGRVVDSYVGDPVLYFCKFARLVFLESLRSPSPSKLPPPPPSDEERRDEELKKEAMHGCLDQCMRRKLSYDKRQLILDYYRGEGGSRIVHRKELANELGKSPNALRIEVHRVRHKLESCVVDCVKRKGLA